jgi:K+-transporting ATPase ATPase B chain
MTTKIRIPSRKPRSQRKHTPKAKTKGLYTRAIKQAFVKLDPRIAIKNPVMFVVWIGTIITFLVTIDPNLFGAATGNNPRLFNGLP